MNTVIAGLDPANIVIAGLDPANIVIAGLDPATQDGERRATGTVAPRVAPEGDGSALKVRS